MSDPTATEARTEENAQVAPRPAPAPQPAPASAPSVQPPVQAVTSTPEASGEPPVIDSDIAAKAQQNLMELARKKKIIDEVNVKKLSPTDQQWLNGLKCAENTSGALTIFGSDGNPIADVTNDRVSSRRIGAVDSDENINAMLQSSIIAKAKFGDHSVDVNGREDKSYLMLIKSSELAGLKINNKPEKGQTLDDKYPEIARRMEQQWAIMHGQQPAPGLNSPSVPAMKAKDLADAIKSGKPLLLEVTSENCQWCDKEKPEVSRIAAQAGDKVQVAQIDINDLNDYISHLDDKNPLKQKLNDILHNENTRFGVPAIGVFENGDLKSMKSGYQTADQIRQFTNDNLSPGNALPAPSAAASTPAAPRPNTPS